MNVRVLKFDIQIPYEKIVDPYFCLCSSYAPFWSYAPLKTKFENLVCMISQKVFKLRAFIFGTLVGAEKKITRLTSEDFPSNFDKITPF